MVRAYSRAGPPNPSNLEPRGVCDRCRRTYRLADLQDQHDWRGTQLVNLNIKVCPTCLDDPSPAFRTVVIGPDPEPLRGIRPGRDYTFYTIDELATEGGDDIITEDGDDLITDIPNPTN